MTHFTQDQLREWLNYDPNTGVFTWKPRPRVAGGKRAGNVSPLGYLRIGLGGKPNKVLLAHRIAWAWMTGEWPTRDIDHINGDKLDNRFSNLRDVPRSTNLENLRAARRHNKSGLLGVSKCGKSWHAAITVKGERMYLGAYSTADEAHKKYIEVKRLVHVGCSI